MNWIEFTQTPEADTALGLLISEVRHAPLICALPTMPSAARFVIDNCKANGVLIYRQVSRPCNYVHIIIIDGVALRVLNEVRQRMFWFDWKVVRETRIRRKSVEFPINQRWEMERVNGIIWLHTLIWWQMSLDDRGGLISFTKGFAECSHCVFSV